MIVFGVLLGVFLVIYLAVWAAFSFAMRRAERRADVSASDLARLKRYFWTDVILVSALIYVALVILTVLGAAVSASLTALAAF